jgi:hypothetical protein
MAKPKEVSVAKEAVPVVDTTNMKKWEEAVMLPVGDLFESVLNPVEMTPVQLEALKSSIRDEGFSVNIVVTPHPEFQGKWLVVDGAHRLLAAKALKFKEVPCCIKNYEGVEWACSMIRRNNTHGTINGVKLEKVINFVAQDGNVAVDQMVDKMGFESQEVLAKFVAAGKKEDKEVEEEVKKDKKKKKDKTEVHDTLNFVIGEILDKGGETLENGYLFFTYRDKTHLVVRCEELLYEATKKIAESLKRDNANINDFLMKALKGKIPTSDSEDYSPGEDSEEK